MMRPMADRKRKRKRQAAAAKTAARRDFQPPPAPSGRDAMTRGYARAEERNAKIRDELEPLQPGERPKVLLAAIAWTGLLAVGTVVNAILADGDDAGATRFSNGLMTLLFVVAMVYSWKLRYWALMGTQTVLAIAMVVGIIALLGITKLWLLPLLFLHVGISGYLFFRMVKVLARVQKAEREEREGRA
jgi:hypothetical protein